MNLSNFENMDPILVFSLINTKLRDDFDGDLDKLASYYDINRAALEAKLSKAGFDFIPEAGQFR
ncbi:MULTISPECIES: DUF4250 domain-containing protein [Vibrio]|uniref:DUF4250 domain-containing protein n=2 Tax=Vibrio TaxID=662 RepID=A0A7X4LKX9_9VIBR|nr:MULTISPECIES: DUF4250 domain-containing protein [Vibrio]MBF8998977.1 DUF4250 domain-containing protein [Vibrio nitrifigilis]MZI93496.1 DUF4250 domain-containing protein [Vibrio eleionomae]